MGVYQLGTAVTVTETFKVLGVPTDPTTVTYTVQDPLGAETTYVFGVDAEVTNPAVGVYVLDLPPAVVPGQWLYEVAGTGAVVATGSGTFTVLQSTVAPQDTPLPQRGPCVAWADCDDVRSCAADTLADDGILDDVAMAASQALYELSGRRYSGSCDHYVRPCATITNCWSHASEWSGTPWSWGWNGTSWGWYDDMGSHCSCRSLARVTLPGYPVTRIDEVKVDGATIPSSDYRLDNWRYLTRMRDPAAPNVSVRWPGCQNLDLPDTEPGTWSVRYTAGIEPPLIGQRAAAELAVQLYQACAGGDCALPTGVTRVIRQGVTLELNGFASWAHKPALGWRTGLPQVDLFLNAYNPNGLQRRPAVFSPDVPSYAPTVGA